MASLLELTPGLYEVGRFDANILRDFKKIGFVRLEEMQQRREERRLGGVRFQLMRPDSGQIDEPLRPPSTPERCCKGGQGESDWVIVVRLSQRLRQSSAGKGKIFGQDPDRRGQCSEHQAVL